MDPVSIEPRTVPDNATEFEANGKTYRKANSLSFNRYGWMEQLQVKLGFGRDPHEMFKSEAEAFGLLNKMKFAEAAVHINNNMSGLAAIAEREPHPIFKMFALFWNYEGENVGTMTDDLMAEKMVDFDASGIDSAFFFRSAMVNVPGLLAAYRACISHFSTEILPTGPEPSVSSELKT
jgi:hypothetical protein